MDQKFCNNKLENGILCGSFGCVVKVEDTETQKHYAGKISAASDELLVQEYNILKKLNENESNPHILQLKKKEGVVEDLCDFKFSEDYELINEERNEVLKEFRKDDNCKMMLMEYLEGGDLFDYISSLHDKRIEFDIDKVREIFKQIIEGIEFCHSKNIYHFDLKPQNFVFTDKSKSSIKIIDFGLAKEGCDFKIDIDKIGTIGYFAPELLRIFISKDNIINSKCSACDIFSIGIILLTMVRNQIIIEHKNRLPNVLLYYQSIRTIIKTCTDDNFTEEFKELLLGMLEDKPSERLTIAQIKETAWYNDVLFEIDQSNENDFEESRSKVPNYRQMPLFLYYIKKDTKEEDLKGYFNVIIENDEKNTGIGDKALSQLKDHLVKTNDSILLKSNDGFVILRKNKNANLDKFSDRILEKNVQKLLELQFKSTKSLKKKSLKKKSLKKKSKNKQN